MADKLTCIVTVHGIGFQEPPQAPSAERIETRGYADLLHANLSQALGSLSDDPRRQKWQTAQSFPIYVCSSFEGSREQGLKRLGTWVDKFGAGDIDADDAPLVVAGRTIAHIALVYSPLEDLGPQPEATAETFFKALAEHRHYGSIAASLHTVLLDLMAAHKIDAQLRGTRAAVHVSSLQPRTDSVRPRRHLLRWRAKPSDSSPPTGLLGTLLQNARVSDLRSAISIRAPPISSSILLWQLSIRGNCSGRPRITLTSR